MKQDHQTQQQTPPRPERIRFLGMGVDNVSFDEAARMIYAMAESSEPHYVYTPNVDHFMRIRTDAELRGFYENVDLSLADGMPVVWASKILGCPVKEKVSGSDLFIELCRGAAERSIRIFLLGSGPGVADQAADVLRQRFPGLDVVGTFSPRVNADGTSPDQAEIGALIERTRPGMLFVALGCPKQEKWIARHYRELGVPVCLGVGASLDFVAGTQKRAPRWMQKICLEWFWRMVHNPRTLCKRYLIDDLPFLWHVGIERIRRCFSNGESAKPTGAA